MNDTVSYLIMLLLFTLGVIMGSIIGRTGTENKIQNEAVKQGFAAFHIDDDNVRQFKWIKK